MKKSKSFLTVYMLYANKSFKFVCGFLAHIKKIKVAPSNLLKNAQLQSQKNILLFFLQH